MVACSSMPGRCSQNFAKLLCAELQRRNSTFFPQELVIVGQEWVSHRISMEPQTPCSPGDRAPQLLLRGNSLILDMDHSPVAASGAAGAATGPYDPEKMIGAGATTAVNTGRGIPRHGLSVCLPRSGRNGFDRRPAHTGPHSTTLCLFTQCPTGHTVPRRTVPLHIVPLHTMPLHTVPLRTLTHAPPDRIRPCPGQSREWRCTLPLTRCIPY